MIAEKSKLFFSFNMDLKMYTELLATYLLPQAAMHGAILQAFAQCEHIESA